MQRTSKNTLIISLLVLLFSFNNILADTSSELEDAKMALDKARSSLNIPENKIISLLPSNIKQLLEYYDNKENPLSFFDVKPSMSRGSIHKELQEETRKQVRNRHKADPQLEMKIRKMYRLRKYGEQISINTQKGVASGVYTKVNTEGIRIGGRFIARVDMSEETWAYFSPAANKKLIEQKLKEALVQEEDLIKKEINDIVKAKIPRLLLEAGYLPCPSEGKTPDLKNSHLDQWVSRHDFLQYYINEEQNKITESKIIPLEKRVSYLTKRLADEQQEEKTRKEREQRAQAERSEQASREEARRQEQEKRAVAAIREREQFEANARTNLKNEISKIEGRIMLDNVCFDLSGVNQMRINCLVQLQNDQTIIPRTRFSLIPFDLKIADTYMCYWLMLGDDSSTEKKKTSQFFQAWWKQTLSDIDNREGYQKKTTSQFREYTLTEIPDGDYLLLAESQYKLQRIFWCKLITINKNNTTIVNLTNQDNEMGFIIL